MNQFSPYFILIFLLFSSYAFLISYFFPFIFLIFYTYFSLSFYLFSSYFFLIFYIVIYLFFTHFLIFFLLIVVYIKTTLIFIIVFFNYLRSSSKLVTYIINFLNLYFLIYYQFRWLRIRKNDVVGSELQMAQMAKRRKYSSSFMPSSWIFARTRGDSKRHELSPLGAMFFPTEQIIRKEFCLFKNKNLLTELSKLVKLKIKSLKYKENSFKNKKMKKKRWNSRQRQNWT